jgi:hypothetical protein
MIDNRAQPVAKGIFTLAEAVRTQLAALEADEVGVSKR